MRSIFDEPRKSRNPIRMLLRSLPSGGTLPTVVWARRHAGLTILLGSEAVMLVVFAVVRGFGIRHALLEGAIVASPASVASFPRFGRTNRTLATTLGLLTACAVLVHISGGMIEAHFMFFVTVPLIALYQDWTHFLVAVGFTVVHHGTFGLLDPRSVFNHAAAWRSPWKWAGIHGVFVLAASTASLVAWRLTETARARTALILESAGDGIYGIDEGGRIAFLNPAAAAMLGCEARDVVGLAHTELLADREGDGSEIAEAVRTGRTTRGSATFVRGESGSFSGEFLVTPILERGEVVGGVVSFRDVTDRERAESVLSDQALVTEMVVRGDPLASILAAIETMVDRHVSGHCSILLDIEDGGTRRLHSVREDESAEWAALISIGADLTPVATLRLAGPAPRSPEQWEIVERARSLAAIAIERRTMEQRLTVQAFHDSVTGLANRVLFRDRVEHALSRSGRDSARVGVLFIDLDNFKRINDSLGHAIGDQVLRAVGDRIRQCLRASDTAARLGGDEFAVLLEEDPTTQEASEVAARLLDAIGRPVRVGTAEIEVRASIGVATGEASPGEEQDLLRNADVAMYAAKSAGKGTFSVFSPEMHYEALERMELEADLRGAVERGEIAVRYQPVVELATGEITGFEALVRWEHPRRGLLAPQRFMDVAEDSGLLVPIGRHVLAQATARLAEWRAVQGPGSSLRVGVNVSAREINEVELARDVETALERAGLPAGALVVEVTESAILRDVERAAAGIKSLRDLGVLVAIDDFGTGYSSLSHLLRFEVDLLKIDKIFVANVDRGPEDAAIAKAICRIAEGLGLECVGEGIERPGQGEVLLEMGCRLGQGFHLGRPMTAAAVTRLLARGETAPEIALA